MERHQTDPAELRRCEDGRACGSSRERRSFIPEDQEVCDRCALHAAGVGDMSTRYTYGDRDLEAPMILQSEASAALARTLGCQEAAQPDMRLLALHGLAVPVYDPVDFSGDEPLVHREALAAALHLARARAGAPAG